MSEFQDCTLYGAYAWTDTLKGVYYGPGCIKTALPKVLKQIGGSKVLIVTGKSLREKTDIIINIENLLKGLGLYGATFSDIGQHSPIGDIKKGLQIFRDVKADVIVSVGGGSPVDAAKIMISEMQNETGGEFLKQIAIPTTLSAAEYTFGAGYKNEQGLKVGISGEQLAPAGIILDAEVTLATPEWLWLSTGIRALDHAVENLYRPLVPYPCKVLCYGAIADLFQFLPECKKNPKDLAVRQRLQLASWMSLWPLKMEKIVTFGLSHDLSKKMGATYDIPHGVSSCLTLAPAVALQAEIASPEFKTAIANSCLYRGKASTGSVEGDIRQLAADIQQLIDDLGLKTTLTEYKVPKGDVPLIVERTIGTKEGVLYDKVVKIVEGLY